MRRVVVVALALLMAAVFWVAELMPWQPMSEKEVRNKICDAFLIWLTENEQSPEYKAAQKKSREERTVRERTVFDAVEVVRADIEKCGKAT